MSTFFTADTHFGHKNIIEYCKRPFKHVDEMDDALIRRWNRAVQPSDTVYHLGDFSMGQKEAYYYRRRLNGGIHLVVGNHERKALNERGLWDSIHDISEIGINEDPLTNPKTVILCHYAMRVWNHAHHGSWHLYGHSHGSLADDWHALSLDVGVDCWDFTPVSVGQLQERMDKKVYQSVDHHGRPDRFDQQPGF